MRRFERMSACAFLFGVASCLAAFPGRADAVSLTWDNGGGDNNWFGAANWDPDAVPGYTDDLSVLEGTPIATTDVMTANGGLIRVSGAGTSFTVTKALIVAYAGVGTLNITDGGSVSSDIGGVGVNRYAEGTVMVSGTGSRWTNDRHLSIGTMGRGTLTVIDGGAVHDVTGYIASYPDSAGTVTIGPGSQWTNSGNLYVGGLSEAGGNAELTVAGLVTVGNTLMLWNTSTITLDGGHVTCGFFDNSHGGTFTHTSGTLEVTGTFTPGTAGYTISGAGNPTVRLAGGSAALSDTLYVGYSGAGTLTVTDGGAVRDLDGYIASQAGSVGAVTIDAASEWTNDRDMYIGGGLTTAGGDADLNVSGLLTVANRLKIYGPGTVTLDGGRVECGIFDNTRGGTFHFDSGTLAFTGDLLVNSSTPFAAADNDTISSARTLEVAGALTVGAGGTLTVEGGYVTCGNFESTGGDAFVYNTGRLDVVDRLTVGSAGALTLDGGYVACVDFESTGGDALIHNGGTLEVADTVSIGAGGTLTLDGANVSCRNFYDTSGGGLIFHNNSSLTISGGVFVAGITDWTLDGVASGDLPILRLTAGATGNLGSRNLSVGYSGAGALEILDGSRLVNARGFIGGEPGGSGTVTVAGAGSTWKNYASLNVGREGAGTLNIADGGEVEVIETT